MNLGSTAHHNAMRQESQTHQVIVGSYPHHFGASVSALQDLSSSYRDCVLFLSPGSHSLGSVAIAVLCLFALLIHPVPAKGERSAFEGYYLRSSNFPDFSAAWTPGEGFADRELQGVTHDDNHWYFTWTDKDAHMGYLWQVPIDVPLDDNVLANSRVAMVNVRQFADINGGVAGVESDKALWHWGDPDYYKYENNGAISEFVAVPIDGAGQHYIGFFRVASDTSGMTLIGFAELISQTYAGWCAIHPKTGVLYSSDNYDYAAQSCDDQNTGRNATPRTLRLFRVPWPELASSQVARQYDVTPFTGDIPVLRDDRGALVELYNLQGGAFSESGELLYLSAGSGCCVGIGDGQEYAFDGVHAFDATTWIRNKRSLNHRCSGNPACPTDGERQFDYYYRLGCDGAGAWSPEGITVWDLDTDRRAPNIRGRLHVLAFHFRGTDVNRDVMEHFTNRISVDGANGVDQELPADLGDEALPGTQNRPFRTFGFALNEYPAWDGGEIALKGGSYSERGTFSVAPGVRVRVVADGGVAVIGR